METHAFTHSVFVDFENVPEADLRQVEGKPVHVTLLIGKKQTKLELTLVQQIHRLASQVELVEVGASGHNALDLTLAYYLGRALESTPGAQFHIVSKDKDFEPLISHLHNKNIRVARCDSFAILPFLSRAKSVTPVKKPASPVKPPPADRRAKVIARLKDPINRNRPSTRLRLLAHLKTALGKEASDAMAADIVSVLSDGHVLTIDDKGRVSWLR